MKVVKYQHGLSRNVLESTFLEILKTWVDTALLWLTFIVLDVLQRSLATSAVLRLGNTYKHWASFQKQSQMWKNAKLHGVSEYFMD